VTTDRKTALGALLLLAVLALYYWRSAVPQVTIDPRSLGDHHYDPFIHWRTHEGDNYWVRPYPVQVGANCLPRIVQNENIGRATGPREELEALDNASYPQ
jgi:hypothetical protein